MPRDRRAYMKIRNGAVPPEVNAARSRAWRATNPERNQTLYRGQHCKRLYGITLEEKDALLASQGDKCAICRTTEPRGKGWHVDHCHVTKKNRGILCHSCNLGLGQFKDSAALLRRAARYLRSHDAPHE